MIIRTAFINNLIGWMKYFYTAPNKMNPDAFEIIVQAASSQAGKRQQRVSNMVILIGFMFGTAISWSSPVIPKILNQSDDSPFDTNVTETEISWMTSLVVLGSCLGCWIFGFLTCTVGRRISLIILGIPMAASYLVMALIKTISIFCIARFVMGLTLGGGSIVTMTYASEIASKTNRGIVNTLCGMAIGVGVLFSYCVGPWIHVTTLNIILSISPFITIALCIIFCEESPYFYVLKGKEDLAKKALTTFRPDGADLEADFKEILAKIEEQRQGNFLEIIKSKAFIKSFIISNMLLIFQQFTGVTGISMYSQPIFDKTGSNLPSAVCSIILGTLNLIGGIVAPVIVDRYNRRLLMILSCLGMIFFETILGVYCIFDKAGKVSSTFNFLPILCLSGFMFTYNFGIGPICWVVTSEIYAARVKAWSMAFSVFTYNIVGFLIARYFHAVEAVLGIGMIFLIFAGCCVLCIVFILFYVIETKGKTLEQIQDELK